MRSSCTRWLSVGVLLAGLGCGRVSFETVWTVDGPSSATDGDPPPADGPSADGPSADGPSPPPADLPPDGPGAPGPDAAPDLAPDTASGSGSGVTLTGETATAREGWTTSGTLHRDHCPPGEVVIGYQGTQNRSPTMPWLHSLQTQCGSLVVGPGPTYTISTTVGTLLPLRGSGAGDSWSRMCPSNLIVVGFTGRSSGYVDQVAFRCARLMVTEAPGGYALTLGPITTTDPTDSNSGSPFSPIDCPAGQIAAGSNITADNFPRSFGLFCTTASVSLP